MVFPVKGVIKPYLGQDTWGYSKPEGYSLGGHPVRITRKEWKSDLDDNLSDSAKVFYHWHFTLYQWLDWTGNSECGGYDYAEVIEIYLCWKPCDHKRCSRHMIFGPHKNTDLAREKALKFLVEHGLVKLIEE